MKKRTRPARAAKRAKAPAAADTPRARKPRPRRTPARRKQPVQRGAVEAVPVTAEELRVLQRELERRMSRPKQPASASTHSRRVAPRGGPMRWNPDPEDLQKSVAQLVLTIVEFLRQLMERQAIRRMEARTLTDAEVEAVGAALMRLEETVRDIGARFGLTPDDLNLDLGPVKLI